MFIWANPGWIGTMMACLLKDWINWKSSFSRSYCILSFLLALSLIPKGCCQSQDQHRHRQLAQEMLKVSHGLSSQSVSGASDTSGYFLLQEVGRPMEMQSQSLPLGLNEYDGSGKLELDLQERSSTSSYSSSSASVGGGDDDVSNGSLERSLSPSRQFRDISQMQVHGDHNHINHNHEDDGQGRLGGGVEGLNFNGGIKTKRSIGLTGEGLGPIRVFKYVSEDQILQSIAGENSVGVDDNVVVEKIKIDGNKFKSENYKSHRKIRPKSQYRTDLKSSTVTDRSLIPNSFFGSESESRKYNQTDNQTQEERVSPAINSSFNGTSMSTSNDFIGNGTSSSIKTKDGDGTNSEANSSAKLSEKGSKNVRRKKKDKLSKRRLMSNAEFLLFNASLSERSRRSPFKNAHYQPIMYQNRLMQQQQFQHQQHQQKQLNNRFAQIQQSKNRAALYLRNGIHLPLNAVSTNGFQMSRFPSPQKVQKMQLPYPNLHLAAPPPPPKTIHDVRPSSSNNYYNYHPSPQGLPYNVNSVDPNIPESSWNHPMYRRYSKVAKRVQNKVSGVIGNLGKGQGGSNSRRDHHNKGKPIPLPRPKPFNNKGRRIRSRTRGVDANGNIKYSYPKSAQNIQDILKHFNQDNNEILDYVANPTKNTNFGSGGGGGGGGGRGGGSHGGMGPGGIADISSELNDVRFSLLRDIREFAKRPNEMPRDDDSSTYHRPSNSDPSNRYRDGPPPTRAPFYSDVHRKTAHRPSSDDFPSHSSSYQNDDENDELSHNKAKPVRDMAKSPTKYGGDEIDRDSSSSREREFQHSKKRDRDPYFRDREGSKGSNNKDFDDQSFPYEKHGPKYFEEDSTERYPPREDRYKNDRPIRHYNSGEVQRGRPGPGSKEDRVRDRDSSYMKEPTKRPRTKFSHRDSDDFNSFESRNQYYRPKESTKANNKRNKELMDYPRSIRDKIRETSMEFDRPSNKIPREPSSEYRTTNKPIVIKRPYEPYRMPPGMISPFEASKKQAEEDYWNTYGSATEKSLYGYNPKSSRPTPLVIGTPGGRGYTPRYGGSTSYQKPAPSTSPEDDDILEIHTGGQPNNLGHDRIQEKSLQKAYMELLQHKMQAESALMNTPHMSSPSGSPKSKKAAMRMKIHIYPNTEAGPLEMTTGNFNTFGNQMNYGGSGFSESHPSNTLSIAPRPSSKIGGSLRSSYMNQRPGPAPPIQIGYGSEDSGKPSLSSSDKNKNLVLHLHVHRRNDVGPVEMEAEASDIRTSTIPPLTYKDIFDGHNQKQQENQDAGGGGDQEPDKSVSMEVPIHDDKIEDVLHTLLQFRDRGDSRKKRNNLADQVT